MSGFFAFSFFMIFLLGSMLQVILAIRHLLGARKYSVLYWIVLLYNLLRVGNSFPRRPCDLGEVICKRYRGVHMVPVSMSAFD